MNGKGDRPRNCYTDQYRDNYDRIFRGPMKTKKPLRLHEQPAGNRPVRGANPLVTWYTATNDLGTVKVTTQRRKRRA